MVAGLRSLAKAMELPPEPTVRAPAPDPTCERPVAKLRRPTHPHICGRTRKGHFTVLRQTMRQRQQAKLRTLKEELQRRMHTPIGEQGAYLRAVLAGHFRYYGVPMNGPALSSLCGAVGRLWWRILRRRSQKHHLPWRRMRRYIQRWLPPVRICHPYPLQRLHVVTQGGSRMR
jgi:RNA-directed DNA polymerase